MAKKYVEKHGSLPQEPLDKSDLERSDSKKNLDKKSDKKD